MVISGDARGRLDAFRIHGLKVAADVKRVDNKLRIERVLEGWEEQARSASCCCTRRSPLWTRPSRPSSTARCGPRSRGRGRQRELPSHLAGVPEAGARERLAASAHASARSRTRRLRTTTRRRLALPPEPERRARHALARWETLGRFELEAGEHAPTFDDGASLLLLGEEVRPLVERLTAPIIVDERAQAAHRSGPTGRRRRAAQASQVGIPLPVHGGDEARLKRRERAEEALRTGNCPMPQLGLLMEGGPRPRGAGAASASRGRSSSR
jgi:hypothetical protein